MTWETLDSGAHVGLCALALYSIFEIGAGIGRQIRSWVRR